jgi:hypothetical protein
MSGVPPLEFRMPRQPIQVAYEAGPQGRSLIVLCNDGTLWEYVYEAKEGIYKWVEIPGPPHG